MNLKEIIRRLYNDKELTNLGKNVPPLYLQAERLGSDKLFNVYIGVRYILLLKGLINLVKR